MKIEVYPRAEADIIRQFRYYLVDQDAPSAAFPFREEVIESTKAEVMTLLRSTVRPEFLNRVDEIIMFEPLTMKDVRAIVQLQLDMLMNKLAEKDYQLIPSAELVNHISEQGYDPQFGARPIKRMIQKELMNELSRQIIAGTVETGVKQVIDVSGPPR